MMQERSSCWLELLTWICLLTLLSGTGHTRADTSVPFPDVLTLQHALEMLDHNYPDAMAAQAAINFAEAKLLSVDAVHAAKVYVEGELRQSDRHIPAQTDFIDDSRMRLVLNKPLTDFGLTQTRRQGAHLNLNAKQLEYHLVRTQNRLKVIEAFLDVVLSDYAYIVADEEMTLAFLRYDRELEKMERFGDANPIEVGEREVLYLDKFAVRTTVANQRRRSRLRLALVLNRPDAYPDQMVEPDISTYDRPVPDYDEMLTKVLDNAAEMGIARLNVASSRKRLAAAKMIRPTVGMQLEATGYSESYTGSGDDLRASAFIRIPIYSGIHRDAKIAEAAAALDQAQAQLSSLEYDLRIKVLKLVQRLASNRDEANAAAAELEYRERELDRIRIEYELDYRSSIGEANLNVAKALHRVMQASYEKVLIWEQLDALTNKAIVGASAS